MKIYDFGITVILILITMAVTHEIEKKEAPKSTEHCGEILSGAYTGKTEMEFQTIVQNFHKCVLHEK